MIELQTVRYQNFLSTGNIFTEVQLNSHKTTLISGLNGSGKTTAMDAICFVLFNKPFRKITKPKLVNSTTGKGTLVELEMNVSGVPFLIRRGIKPNLFEIYQNGVFINQDASSRDFQKWLEEDVIKTNHKSFCQTVILGNANYVPFMRLDAAARRAVVEDLLDLQIFSAMNAVLKKRISESKEAIIVAERVRELAENTLEIKKEHIKELRDNSVKLVKDKQKSIKDNNKKVLALEKQNAKIEAGIEELEKLLSKKSEVEDNLDKVTKAKTKAQKMAREAQESIDFYDKHETCPTCVQKIDEDFKIIIIKDRQTRIENSTEVLGALNRAQEALLEEKSKFRTTQDQILKLQAQFKENQAAINLYNKLNANIMAEIEVLSNPKKVKGTDQEEQALKDANKTYEELLKNRELLSIASVLLKDTGIKTQIIKQYLPLINKNINQFLEHMGFFCQFHLDENFKETIKSRHRDEFTYESFSEGEKMRINLAILFTWRAVARIKNTSPINLLILDEIMDSSLDGPGTDEFLYIIGQLTGDNNVFVISHKHDQISDKFDNTIQFEKKKGFSKIVR